MPPLPSVLAEMSPRLARIAAPVVEQVAKRLGQGQDAKVEMFMFPTLLTQAKRSAGRDAVRTTPKREVTPERPAIPAGCRECGVILTDQDRQYCESCWPKYQQEHIAVLSDHGRTKIPARQEARIRHMRTKRQGSAKRCAMGSASRRYGRRNTAQPLIPTCSRKKFCHTLKARNFSPLAKTTSLWVPFRSHIRGGLKLPQLHARRLIPRLTSLRSRWIAVFCRLAWRCLQQTNDI